MIVVRWFVSLVLGGFITLGLFYAMQALIATGSQLEERVNVVKMVDATMPDIEMEVIEEIQKPEEIQEVEEDPPPPERETTSDTGPQVGIQTADVDVGAGLDLQDINIGVTDGDMLPLVNIQPNYPTRAASRGITGWCQVSFTVTETGGVRDVVVVDAEPRNIFDRSSIRAAEKFKFQPRVVNGEAVEVPNVQYVFTYVLEGER